MTCSLCEEEGKGGTHIPPFLFLTVAPGAVILSERAERARREGSVAGNPDYCIASSKTSYSACVHAVIPNPRARYNAEKNSPATIRNANEYSCQRSP